mmetsp:Transcript_45439/g.71219  ORF Transcript_45439/g.71219 Transcript_45439/m.71219 type:complete len:152 (-) Transcript_45439:91-546(-)
MGRASAHTVWSSASRAQRPGFEVEIEGLGACTLAALHIVEAINNACLELQVRPLLLISSLAFTARLRLLLGHPHRLQRLSSHHSPSAQRLSQAHLNYPSDPSSPRSSAAFSASAPKSSSLRLWGSSSPPVHPKSPSSDWSSRSAASTLRQK